MSRNAEEFNQLIDLEINELNVLIKDYELSMESIRKDIGKVYEKAEPFLLQIRDLKKKYKEISVKYEATKTFLQVEKGGSLVSGLDLSSLHDDLPEIEPYIQEPRRGRQKIELSAVETAAKVVRVLSKSPVKKPYSDIQSRIVSSWSSKKK